MFPLRVENLIQTYSYIVRVRAFMKGASFPPRDKNMWPIFSNINLSRQYHGMYYCLFKLRLVRLVNVTSQLTYYHWHALSKLLWALVNSPYRLSRWGTTGLQTRVLKVHLLNFGVLFLKRAYSGRTPTDLRMPPLKKGNGLLKGFKYDIPWWLISFYHSNLCWVLPCNVGRSRCLLCFIRSDSSQGIWCTLRLSRIEWAYDWIRCIRRFLLYLCQYVC
jgi:hypothetical protein